MPVSGGRWVNLIHETLIRSKGLDAAGKPQPYWPTLWAYIENNKKRAARRERLHLMAREWKGRKGFSRLFGLAGWSSLFGFRGLAAPGSLERRYIRWSRASTLVRGIFTVPLLILILLSLIGTAVDTVFWAVDRWTYQSGYQQLRFPALQLIPAGSFMMGSNISIAERPVHPVTFSQSFDLGRTEVTFREWDGCVADSGCSGYRPYHMGWGREARPVINVSCNDAQAYVAWLSRKTGRTCRLPSEAEWEYAARAGTTTEYALPAPGGSDDIAGKRLANCRGDCGSEWDGNRTAPVASFPANAWGVHDMHSNVGEWVEDCWHESYAGAPEDGRAWLEGEDGKCSTRVLRSGSVFHDLESARSAWRDWAYADQRFFNAGFRVVCSSP